MGFSAALDFSGREAAFAAADREKSEIFFESYREIKGRDSSALLPWINETLAGHGLGLDDITEWTVGNGPGSFTGLRIAAALVAGFSFHRKSVKTRGMSIAAGIAVSAGLSGNDECAVLFDGRNSEVILCSIKKIKGSYIESSVAEIRHSASLDAALFRKFNSFRALEKDREALKKLLPPEIFGKIFFAPHIHVSELIFNAPSDWSGNITDLIYIRPATLAPPLSSGK